MVNVRNIPDKMTAKRAGGPALKKPDRTVVLVDDDDDMVSALSEALEEEGYRVYAAFDGKEAYELLRGIRAPLAIILDLMMPVMDGWRLIDLIDTDPDMAKIPKFVITSARTAVTQSLVGLPIFVKPLRVDDVLRALKTFEPPPASSY